MKSIHRFTLIELLAVMALIAILGSIGFGVYSYSKNKAKESATEALMKQLEAGLEKLHDNSHYPRSSAGGFSPIIVTLATDGTVETVNFGGETLTRQTGVSLKKQQRLQQARFDAFVKSLDMQVINGNVDSGGAILDAWGNRIYYRSPGGFKSGGYDLISAGPDGLFGCNPNPQSSGKGKENPNDITDVSWFRDNDGDKTSDDLFNF